MKKIQFPIILLLVAGSLVRCSTHGEPSATSTVSLKMSASTPDGKAIIGGRTMSAVTLADVKVNIREIKFEFDEEDDHFKKDSAFQEDDDSKLKGPFIVDLMNAGAFVDQVVTTVNVPNAKYEKIKFKLAPSAVAGDMDGKSILINGTIGSTPFIFWHNANAHFGAKFPDSTSLATNGAAVTLAIHLELDKVLNVLNGGIDLSNAVDGNQDGTITIDPLNDDGNKEMADAIMMLLTHHTHCEKENH